MFTDILAAKTQPPEEWKTTKLRIIFKKGDAEMPENYRPISLIPVLAKAFSTVMYLRMVGVIEHNLTEEQYGFRPGRGCSDAVQVLQMVVEKSGEWGSCGLQRWMRKRHLTKSSMLSYSARCSKHVWTRIPLLPFATCIRTCMRTCRLWMGKGVEHSKPNVECDDATHCHQFHSTLIGQATLNACCLCG